MMYFEERLLQPYAQMLTAEKLEEGEVYFDASFLDRQMVLPSMEPFVYIGRNLDAEVEPGLYFQDLASYSAGVRFGTSSQEGQAIFVLESEEKLHFFDYEHALNQYLRSWLRRQGASVSEPMLFEGRWIGASAEPILPESLQESSAYFSLVFRDQEKLAPALGPYIFLGKDLRPGDHKRLYFQDFSSYRKGVRLELDTKIDQAQFVVEGEDEANYFFDYEQALEELMRCSLRRREAGLTSTPRRTEAVIVSEEPQTRSFRFEDPELQQRLIAELRNAPLMFELREDGAVVYANTDGRIVGRAKSAIEDACFRGYYLLWGEGDFDTASRFKERLRELDVPFLVEYEDAKFVFFLPKGSEDIHDQILESVYNE